MTELTLLADTYYFESIGQNDQIRHNGARGEFHNVEEAEAKRLFDAGLAVPGRIAAADLPEPEPAEIVIEPEEPAPEPTADPATTPTP